MRHPSPSDALRLFLIASLGLTPLACGKGSSGSGGDGDSGDGDGDGETGDGDSGDGDTGDGDSGDGDPGDGDGDGIVDVAGCTNPTPFIEGQDSGFVRCDEGYVHREKRAACPSVLPRDRVIERPNYEGYGGDLLQYDECERDSDCEGDLSYCEMSGGGEALPFRVCHDSCITDSDCQDGYVCLCGAEFGTCAPGAVNEPTGGCNTDADCSDEEMCVGVFYAGACGPGTYQFSCTPFSSECAEGDTYCEQFDCSLNEAGALVCYPNVVCGRPFLVEEDDRKAVAVFRDDWCSSREGRMSDYQASESERATAAQYFEKIALMEHASIAAFARFSLQLLSLGAPAEFIEETNQALVDETKHARLCFSLASRFGGRRVGPGALSVEGALSEDSVESILKTTILEGCVGETMAALEARAALRVCRDAEVRDVLSQIAADEERHAALAWKVVRWVLEQRPELAGVASEAFAGAVASRESGGGLGAGAPALGVLSAGELKWVHADALDNVVIPCARALFEDPGPVDDLTKRSASVEI